MRHHLDVIFMTPPRSGSRHSTAQRWQHPEINVSRFARLAQSSRAKERQSSAAAFSSVAFDGTPKASPIFPWRQTGDPHEVLTQRRRVSKAAAMRDFLDRTIGQLK